MTHLDGVGAPLRAILPQGCTTAREDEMVIHSVTEGKQRAMAVLDRRVPAWMWPILAEELERLEARRQSEVVLCMDNTGKFYLAEPATLAVQR